MLEQLAKNDYVLMVKKNGSAFYGQILASRTENYISMKIGDFEFFNFHQEQVAAFKIIDSDNPAKLDHQYGFEELGRSYIRRKDNDATVVHPIDYYYVRDGKLIGRVLIGEDWNRVVFERVNEDGNWIWRKV